MAYECETEHTVSYYRCIDPIENFKIKVILKPVKNLFIPLPQFDPDHSSGNAPSLEEECKKEVEEYTFRWQEKIFNKNEIKNYKHSSNKKKLPPDLHNQKKYPRKLFSYVSDSSNINNFSLKNETNEFHTSKQKIKNFGSLTKAKKVNYYPMDDSKNVQKMLIMIDLGQENDETQVKENYSVLCALSYNTSSKLLEMNPSFSKSELKPYIIGINDQDNRNSYYYWLVHASTDISSNCWKKEMEIMTKVLSHQEEIKQLLIGREFFVGQPNYLYITVLGSIISAEDFEYDHLHINYFVKVPTGWECSDTDSLTGVTQTSSQNSYGVTHFCHLFEINFNVELQSLEDSSLSSPEIIFEVLSVDKYNRYRNEGYTYIYIPCSPGMYEYSLKCWRVEDKKLTSKLQRFFIGGGPELEDISYVGLFNTQNPELISRFGFESLPSGKININLSILHQSEFLKKKEIDQLVLYDHAQGRSDTDTLLSNINTVLEAFRKARARMLEAKKGLESEQNHIFHESKSTFKKYN